MFEQLQDVFKAAAFKYLSAVDADPAESNQHEIGGLPKAGIGIHLGMPDDGRQLNISATLVYLNEDGTTIINEDSVTWYDCRFKDPERSPEWRLYYKSNDVTAQFKPGDFLMVALTHEGHLLMIFCPPYSEYENQIRVIFGAQNLNAHQKGLKKIDIQQSIAAPIRLMFARYGLEIGHTGNNYLDVILGKFGNTFPKTKDFSKFARSLSSEACPISSPDSALVEWMETEESIFRQLERHIVREKLRIGFGDDGDNVDEFISFSLSVQNRRKSRSGHAFENHIEYILEKNKIQFQRGALTEGKQKPDFLFPSSAQYQDFSFPSDKLRLLGAKTTCKDRWRQILAEGERVQNKHLITLEHAISESQTAQMKNHGVQLVVPLALHKTYTAKQASWLMSFYDFIVEIKALNK